MGYLRDDFALVAASVERAARVQRAACLRVLSDPSARGQALARHLELAYDAILLKVAERRTEFESAGDDAERADAIVEMRSLLWQVRKLQSNLSWLDAAQAPPLDLGTTYYVEDVARALVAPQVEVTLVTADHLSYATSSDPWRPLIEDWGAGIPADEPTVVVVFIPRREQASGLLHPLIVHELGHAADSERGLVNSIWAAAQQRKRLARRFGNAVQDFATSQNVDVSAANDHVTQTLRSWIAESLCDSVAVHQLGPTYLYSFLSEVAAGTMDEPGPKHPPARQRIRLLMGELDQLGWSEVMRNADPDLCSWIDDCVAQGPAYTDVPGFLTWAVSELRGTVRKEVRSLLKRRVFRPDEDELREVEELLAAGIPPAQGRSGAPIARETIMLASWHAALASGEKGPAALASAPDTAQLVDQLPAALELSALADAWGRT